MAEGSQFSIPPESAPLLGSINFIEGIEHVVLAASGKSRLLVLEGAFELQSLREMAEEDGGTVKRQGLVEVIVPPENSETETRMALVNERIVLLGDPGSIVAALDRWASKARAGRAAESARGHDLWISSSRGAEGVEAFEFGLAIENGLRIEANVRARSPEAASHIARNAPLQNLTAVQSDSHVRITGHRTLEEFQSKAGQWRASLLQLATRAVDEEKEPGMIRIYGLDEGVREIPLPDR